VKLFESKINSLVSENKKLHEMLNEKLGEMKKYKTGYDELLI
jgi:hypothetical protein